MSEFSRGLCESSTCTKYHLQCLNEESGLVELISSFLGLVVYCTLEHLECSMVSELHMYMLI